MKVKVHLLAFGKENEVRFVDMPEPADETERLLEQVFHFGQNDHQPQPHPSVSVGDVAEIGEKFYLVKALGWKEINRVELIQYRAIPRRERQFHALLDPE